MASMRSAPLCVSLLLCACSSDDGAGLDVKSPYPSYTATTETSYQLSGPLNTQASFSAGVSGEKVVAGKTFQKMVVENPDDPSPGRAEFYGTLLSPTQNEVAGGEYTMNAGALGALAGALGIPTTASLTLDAPVTIDFDVPVGEPQKAAFSATVTEGAGGAPESVQVSVDYVLTEKGVTAQTEVGPVNDCWRFEVASQVPLLGIPTDVKGELLYSPTLGLVKAQALEPFKDLGMDFTGNSDFLDLGDGWASIHKVGVVGQGVSSLELNTYDVAQQLDADKNTHAKMFVEVRWVDEETAKTDKKPYVDVTFGTAMGIFPSQLVQAPASAFHPEENGNGFVYWIGFVDQAAKNESGDGIAYRITTQYDPDFSKLRVTSRIVYKRIAVP